MTTCYGARGDASGLVLAVIGETLLRRLCCDEELASLDSVTGEGMKDAIWFTSLGIVFDTMS